MNIPKPFRVAGCLLLVPAALLLISFLFCIPLLQFTPIVFYGKVVTQDGVPIPHAEVHCTVLNKLFGKGKEFEAKADANGRFTLWSMGMSLTVRVEKEGCFQMPKDTAVPGRSRGGFDYGTNLGDGIHKPSRGSPVVFVLYDPPDLEPLIQIREQEIMVPLTGEPARMALGNAPQELILRWWPGARNRSRGLEVSVAGGSIQRRLDNLDFTAPPGGYVPNDLINMAATQDRPIPKSDEKQSYWVKFDDDTYGVLSVRMIAGGHHFAVVSGYRNPKPGSRNVTVDPAASPWRKVLGVSDPCSTDSE